MSFIDWNVAQAPEQNLTEVPQQVQKSALAGYQLGQTGAAYKALRGVNLSDPNSVQSALSGLTSVGAIDQAKALTDLAYTRGVNQAKLPVVQGALGVAQQAIAQETAQQSGQQSAPPAAPPQPGLTDQQTQAMQGVYQKGADAVNDLLSYKDPVLRSAAAATYRNQFIQSGAPPQEVDEVLGDLSDTGLQAHEKWLTAMASGQGGVNHPTGFAASQALLNSDPAYRSAEGVLTGPYANPSVQLGLQAAGLNTPDAVNQALTFTSPARSDAANAAFAPTVAETSARGSAIGSGSVGSPPAPGARLTFDAQGNPDAWILPNGTTQAIEKASQAGAQGSANITTAPPSGHVTTDAAGNPTGVAPTAGYAQTAANTAATVGAAGVSGPAAAQELQADRQTAASSQPQSVALRKVYDLLPTTNTGPGTQATNGWRSFVLSQLPALAPLYPGGITAAQIQTASADELKKYMVQLSGAAAAQYGQGTNEKLAVAAAGNPNPDTSNLAARDVTRMNIALLRAQNAKPALFGAMGLPQTDYPAWAANYGTTVDPRAFMLDLLSPAERRTMLSTITTQADKDKFTRGVQAAEAAGDFARTDIPR